MEEGGGQGVGPGVVWEHEQISPRGVRRDRAHRVGRGKLRQAGEFGM